MSTKTNEEILPKPKAGNEGDTPPARKRTTKKAATKTVATQATVKTAAKKTTKKAAAPKVDAEKPARKTPAKKSVKKAAAAMTPELPFDAPPIPKPGPADDAAPVARIRTSRTKQKTAEFSEPAAAAQPPPDSLSGDDSPRRFGRVPGGGRMVPPKPKAAEATPPPSAPAPVQTSSEPPATSEKAPERDETVQRISNPNLAQAREPQVPVDGQNLPPGQQRESRSKRRRDKRKRRAAERPDQGGHGQQQRPHPNQNPRHHQQHVNDFEDRRPVELNGPKIETNGMLELAPKGFGFLRFPGKNFEQARDDVFVTPEIIRKYNLRLGHWIHGIYQEGPRGPQLVEISKINDLTPAEAAKLPHFDELKAINPAKRISFETTPERFTTRVVDIMAPVGRGQRGLIVSPPRSGKTTLLLHMAEAVREKYEDTLHLMVVLVDERPEEVTEFRRALPGAEIYASSNDEQARNHCRIAELAIERAKRLVEAGKDVFLLMDSITRLARAYNGNMNNRGRGIGSGGITIGALEIPRRLFAAARNTRGGGSLTILATALIQTNSRADEAIFMEFKGTGNMELVLDRKIAENYIYPAVDIFKSGTRREELLLADHMLHKIHLIRRGLSGHRPAEAMERLLFFLKKFPNNPQMLLEIKG
jgi:transcription termination factor Rho